MKKYGERKMKRRILIHGAVNTSNFGDVLFAKIFYEQVKAQGDEPIFIDKKPFGISNFNMSELSYQSPEKVRIRDIDILIFMSGGYFGDNKSDFYLSIVRWMRYFSVGLQFVCMRKKIYVLGVGGAPLYSWFNRVSAKIILNHSEKVTVRDRDTRVYFEKIGVKNKIVETVDTALTINAEKLPVLEDNELIDLFIDNRKTILLHLTGIRESDEKIAHYIVPGLARFLDENDNACLLLSYDNEINRRIEETPVYQCLKKYEPYVYNYHSAMQFCSLINKADTIITTKLHVGIVGACLEKSVISFPLHRHKTIRFYEKIGFQERCIPFDGLKADESLVYRMLEKFNCMPIIIPDEVKALAYKNLEY